MILVTGGTGLVGSHLLLQLLRSGEKVKAIFRKEQSLNDVKKVFSYTLSETEVSRHFNKIEWVKADITDVPSLERAFEDVERVYHCAALVSFDTSRDAQLRKINIEGTANVVNFCIKNKIEKLCYVSSIATMDKAPGKKEISESSSWNKEVDHSMYAITKYGAEMEVWRGSQEGVPVVIVNPGVIIGPGFWDSGSGKLFRKIDSGLKYHFPKVTGFVGVSDVVSIMQKLMNSPVKNQKYILVAENGSFRSVLDDTAKALDKIPPTKELKPWMVTTGWLLQQFSSPFSGKERLLDSNSRKSLFENTFYNSDKVKQELDYNFEPISKVIARTAEIFRKEKKGQFSLREAGGGSSRP